MKNTKKIWLAAILFVAAECLAFPEILFPDCIRRKEITEESRREKEESVYTWQVEGQPDFEWKFWFRQ